MIPRVIHYCWLGNASLPLKVRRCIRSWKKHLPGFEFKLWNLDSLDWKALPFVRDAVMAGKWAFAADYIRCYALYSEGGIYLDTDVLVKKNFDFALENRAFSAIESYQYLIRDIAARGLIDENGDKRDPSASIHGIQIQAAILGSEKGHPFFKDCLDYYNSARFEPGETGVPREETICPIVMANLAVKYGFKYRDEEQSLAEGFHLYPSTLFHPWKWKPSPSAVAIHLCLGSWRKP